MSTTSEYLLSLGQPQQKKGPDWQAQSAAQVQQAANAAKPQPQEYKIPGTEATQQTVPQTSATTPATTSQATTAPQQTAQPTSGGVPSYKDVLSANKIDEFKRGLEQRPAEKKPTTYVDMIRQLYPELSDDRRWQTDEERIARGRKRDAIISSVGDGLAALANIGTTSRYATPLNLSSLSEASQQRYDKIKAERDAKKEAYRSAYLRAKQADDAAEQAARKERAALAEAARKEAKEDKKWQAELMYKMGRAEAEDKYREDKLKQDGELGRSRIKASIDNTRYRINHKGSGSGRGGRYYGSVYDPRLGRDVACATKADFERKWFELYPDEPMPEIETTSTHVDENGDVVTTTTKRKVLTPQARAAAEGKAKKANGNPLSAISIR